MNCADSNYKKKLKRLLARFDIEPKDIDLYIQAFTHVSSADNCSDSYELLEFLGDSVILGHVVSKLVNRYPNKQVGTLSKAKGQIVSRESLANIAWEHKLEKYIIMNAAIFRSGSKVSPGIMADVFEALVGAIFKDQGYRKVQKFLSITLKDAIDIDLKLRTASDFKSILQEEIQRRYKQIPQYRLIKASGPDHQKTFYVSVHFNGIEMGKGNGRCKKDAEQEAARNTLKKKDHYFKKIDQILNPAKNKEIR